MLYRKRLIILCSFFIFIACNEVQKTSFPEINISAKNNTIVEVNIPEAHGNKIIVNNINSKIQDRVIEALHIGNPNDDDDDDASKSIKESILSFNTEYNTFKSDFPETEQQWDAQIDGEVIYESPDIVSIAITSYVNTGGAHGSLHISFLNFDAETGHVIPNNNLINDVEAFKKVAKPYFTKAIAEKEDTFNTNSFNLPSNIAYSEEGFVLLYNTYEIAPYSTGIIEFVIPFDEIEPYLVFNSF